MLSYRHGFHAGNFADVLKHLTLTLLLRALLRKDKPFVYLDTHAGAGLYDLTDRAAQQNCEYKTGIGRLWQQDGLPEAATDYVALVRAFNPDGRLRYYPGSPAIAQHLLRSMDRMVLCEMHGTEYPNLQHLAANDHRVQVHHQDGYKGLKAFLPPRERRGLVLVDPSYEVKSEYRHVATEMQLACRRWASGSYMVWYPLIQGRGREPFGTAFQLSGIPKILRVEMTVDSKSQGMQGSGVLIINPPWLVKEALESELPVLLPLLAGNGGRCKVDWLTPETP